jgi:hypothetical protein
LANSADGSEDRDGEPNLDWLVEMIAEHARRPEGDGPIEINLASIPAFFQDLRDAFDRFQDGNWLALLDALQVCRDERLPPPIWVCDGFQTFIVRSITEESLGQRGRGNSPLAKAREAAKQAKRRETYLRIRLAQKIGGKPNGAEPEDFVFALTIPSETTVLIKAGKLKGLGTSVEDAVKATELSLRGTFAQASYATLLKECRKMRDDTFDTSHETRVALGFETDALPELLGDLQFVDIDDLAPPDSEPKANRT